LVYLVVVVLVTNSALHTKAPPVQIVWEWVVHAASLDPVVQKNVWMRVELTESQAAA
jgi:hypothetical protein